MLQTSKGVQRLPGGPSLAVTLETNFNYAISGRDLVVLRDRDQPSRFITPDSERCQRRDRFHI